MCPSDSVTFRALRLSLPIEKIKKLFLNRSDQSRIFTESKVTVHILLFLAVA